jgi:hypothetical protein
MFLILLQIDEDTLVQNNFRLGHYHVCFTVTVHDFWTVQYSSNQTMEPSKLKKKVKQKKLKLPHNNNVER